MYHLKICTRFFVLSLLFCAFSCVKDIDIDQAQEIVIPPTAAIDLVHATLGVTDFLPQGEQGPLVAYDEVRLEFLDDDYIQNGLVQADFNFLLINTFSQDLSATFVFRSDNNTARYTVDVDIPAGSPSSPTTIDYTEIIGLDEIDAIKESIKMSVEIEMVPNSEAIEGTLQLKSKAFYHFEFQ